MSYNLNNKKKNERLGLEKLNNQGCLMKIVEYNDATDIKVMFLDDYLSIVSAAWKEFNNGSISNPYFPSCNGHGKIGIKYPSKVNGKHTKEYIAWNSMLNRCFDEKYKSKYPTYKDVTCCDEWLLYENFYEWLHSQENFDKWFNGKRWAIDKDILVKGNKIYSPETCCLVPLKVSSLFVKNNVNRGELPIGISKVGLKYRAQLNKGEEKIKFKTRNNFIDCFYMDYKPAKEEYIKHVAQEEFDKCNITKKCYNAMINYEVEIND